MDAIGKAIELIGPSKAATLFGVSVQAVCFWRDGRRRFPPEHCAVLERECGFQFRRWDMRPADWHRVWPELVAAPGAPPVPQPDAA
ncbi:YdaS family helix-turn-helix protein [Rhizobacter sp. Root1221]|uniref:YdaS family helix-turn-helix protein n=1 Tax=Rhizobacter sp. Root1221 TaxID=1736433 RepID=UPI0009EBC7CD